MSVLLFIIVLVVLILVHEFGHFIVAKKTGIRVDEFGLGFPPKLFSVRRGETEYSMNALPFGGFVRIFGENPEDVALDHPDRARSFVARPKPIQAAVMVAGVTANIALAWVLLSFGFMVGLPMPVDGAPQGVVVENARVAIISTADGSPASEAGLLPGDRVLSLSAKGDRRDIASVSDLQTFIAFHGGLPVTVLYERQGERQTAVATPRSGSGIPELPFAQPALGVTVGLIGTVTLPPHRAFFEGARMTAALTSSVVSSFGMLARDAFRGAADLATLTGPVGIAGIIGDAADFGIIYLLGLTAFISINLAVINLLPLPALDGGRLLFLLIEAVRGAPLNPRAVTIAHAVGFAALIILMLVVTFNDIVRIVS
ncbi:MAG: site-2 protease family protein [Parcubacteria group bacterium]|nr:site-2 protease family protein [Parcubacteria group bacterium]